MTLNLENYRTSSEYREILRILQKASSLQENFLWQSGHMGKNIIPIHHFEIDFVSREVVLYFNSKHSKVELGLPLYIKLDYRTSVFKVLDYRQGASSLHFPFPKEIKTLELRNNKRHEFTLSQEKVVSLKPSIAGMKEGGRELQVRTIDVSIFGLGLIISEANRNFIKNNRILWITRLQHEPLDEPLLAEVVYMTNDLDPRFHSRKNRELKVGLKLSGVFPEDNFNKFIQ